MHAEPLLDVDRARAAILGGSAPPAAIRSALLALPARERDAWANTLLGCEVIPEDGPELPRGCVPYLPCAVDVLLRLVDELRIDERDVFVDVGSGVGRAAVLVHLLSGAGGMGVEVQSQLVDASRAVASRLNVERFGVIHGDAAALTGYVMVGTVFFLYCPFGGFRLEALLDDLHWVARTRRIRVCALDLPLPARSWLTPVPGFGYDLQVFESTLHERPALGAPEV